MHIGVIGGGQLGQMLALAGIPLGMRFTFIDPMDNACAQVAGQLICASYNDKKALEQLASHVSCITFEFENIPSETVAYLQDKKPVFPSVMALSTARDRLKEKQLFTQLGIPTNGYQPIDSASQWEAICSGRPKAAVLKTRTLGYDGKGQIRLSNEKNQDSAFKILGGVPCLLEDWIEFDHEVSLIAVRSRQGEIKFYPLTKNWHHSGVLRMSMPVSHHPCQVMAEVHAKKIMTHLSYVGVMAIEFFVKDNQLMANEMAPRVHNSGHWTQDGAQCSQFENHLRAICGLPLGGTSAILPAAMVNCLGTMPDLTQLVMKEGVRVHDYGKDSKEGRKVGHINLIAKTKEGLASLMASLGLDPNAKDFAMQNLTL